MPNNVTFDVYVQHDFFDEFIFDEVKENRTYLAIHLIDLEVGYCALDVPSNENQAIIEKCSSRLKYCYLSIISLKKHLEEKHEYLISVLLNYISSLQVAVSKNQFKKTKLSDTQYYVIEEKSKEALKYLFIEDDDDFSNYTSKYYLQTLVGILFQQGFIKDDISITQFRNTLHSVSHFDFGLNTSKEYIKRKFTLSHKNPHREKIRQFLIDVKGSIQFHNDSDLCLKKFNVCITKDTFEVVFSKVKNIVEVDLINDDKFTAMLKLQPNDKELSSLVYAHIIKGINNALESM